MAAREQDTMVNVRNIDPDECSVRIADEGVMVTSRISMLIPSTPCRQICALHDELDARERHQEVSIIYRLFPVLYVLIKCICNYRCSTLLLTNIEDRFCTLVILGALL